MQHDPDDEFLIAMMAPIVEPLMNDLLEKQEAEASCHEQPPEITWQEFAGNFT